MVASPKTVNEDLARRSDRWTLVVMALILSTYLPLLLESFWLDEFATYLATRGTLAEAFTYRWQDVFISPIYFSLAWICQRALGESEWVFRLPAFGCGLIASYLLYRLVRRLSGSPQAASISVMIFLTLPTVIEQFCYARPYSVCLCFSIAAIDYYLIWLDKGDRFKALLSLFCAVLTVYSHIIFGSLCAVLFTLSLAKYRTVRPKILHLSIYFFLLASLLMPLLLPISQLWRERTDWSLFSGQPSLFGFVSTVFTGSGLVGLGLALLFCFWPTRDRPLTVAIARLKAQGFLVFAVWFLVIVGGIFSVTYFTDARILIRRYLLISTPALAVLIGLLFSQCAVRGLRLLGVITQICFALYFFFYIHHPLRVEDWRRAAPEVNAFLAQHPHIPLLFFPGWVETDQVSRLINAHDRKFLLGPLKYYRISADPIILPRHLSSTRSRTYLANVISKIPNDTDKLLLLSRFSIAPQIHILQSTLGQRWIGQQTLGKFGRVEVVVIQLRQTADSIR